jgi:hypothetical protein
MKTIEKESYLEPEVRVISVLIENGFAASTDLNGGFNHEDSDTEWVEGED